MAEKDYVKTVYVDGSEPDVDAVHLNNTEDGLDGLYHPEFDDSGTVEGITNFPQFLSTVVNKMNPIAFYKNFKAGMAFVLHAGQLVNNGLCNEPGKYPLDAAYGKTLYDYYDRLNSDFGDLSTDLSEVQKEVNPLKSYYVNDINNNIANKVNIVLWDVNTAYTPFKTGNTTRGNGFCITYSSGDPYLCQIAMAVGDSNLFTRHRGPEGWSGWTTK